MYRLCGYVFERESQDGSKKSDSVFQNSDNVCWRGVEPESPYIEGIQVLRGGSALLPEVQDVANQCDIWAQQGITRGYVYHHLPSYGVLMCCELQLAISVSLGDSCHILEGFKVGGNTAEGHILKL